MTAPSFTDAMASLVRDAEVHKDLYLSPRIFELEMRHLFWNTWVYVGHVSQIPATGDYVTTTIGAEPVVMVRHVDGSVRVLHNRCSHKGTQLVTDACGNTGTFFRCPYHAWSYRTDGSLYAIPLRRCYENTGFESCEASKGMQAVGASHEHRGFVFRRLSQSGVDFDAYFGNALSSPDNLVDRSPHTCVRSTTITRATSRATTGCRTSMRSGHSS